jgi:hypothetical protein
LHDTYYVVAHFHYVLSMGAVFALFAGFYYWFLFLTGKSYSEYLGQLHFWTTFFGVNVTFFPMHFLGLAGMPRRIPDYPDVYYFWNSIATFGSYVTTFSLLVFVLVIYEAFVGFSWAVTFSELFKLKTKSGLVVDYKFLIGNTVTSNINYTRVYNAYTIVRPLNYKTMDYYDLGPLVVRFKKRNGVTFRKKRREGPIRARWFRWRGL